MKIAKSDNIFISWLLNEDFVSWMVHWIRGFPDRWNYIITQYLETNDEINKLEHIRCSSLFYTLFIFGRLLTLKIQTFGFLCLNIAPSKWKISWRTTKINWQRILNLETLSIITLDSNREKLKTVRYNYVCHICSLIFWNAFHL